MMKGLTLAFERFGNAVYQIQDNKKGAIYE